MRKTLFIFISAIHFITFAQDGKSKTGFSIRGEVDASVKSDSVYLYKSFMAEELLASAPIENGKFLLEGSVSGVMHPNISFFKGFSGDFFLLENADYTYSRLNNRVIFRGGELNELSNGYRYSDEYYNATQAYEREQEAIEGEKSKAELTLMEKGELLNGYRQAIQDIETRNLSNLLENKDAPTMAKFYALNSSFDFKTFPIEKRLEILEEFKKDPKASPKSINGLIAFYKGHAKKVEIEERLAVGNQFTDIEAQDINGKTIKLSDVVAKNKFTLLEFWASWCAPCRAEIPNLKKAYAEYKPKGFEIYSISIDNKKDEWLAAVKEEGTTWINVVDLEGTDGVGPKDYGVVMVPQLYLISQDGKIVVATHAALIKDELHKVLKKVMQ